MNIDEIIKKYENDPQKRWLLPDGSIVIGEEVDEENKLHYVIKNGDTITVDYAGNHRPLANLIPPTSTEIVVKGTKIIIP